jgi:hypothetical protein
VPAGHPDGPGTVVSDVPTGSTSRDVATFGGGGMIGPWRRRRHPERVGEHSADAAMGDAPRDGEIDRLIVQQYDPRRTVTDRWHRHMPAGRPHLRPVRRRARRRGYRHLRLDRPSARALAAGAAW